MIEDPDEELLRKAEDPYEKVRKAEEEAKRAREAEEQAKAAKAVKKSAITVSKYHLKDVPFS